MGVRAHRLFLRWRCPGKSAVVLEFEAVVRAGARSKMGFDATVKIAGEDKVRAWPMELEMDGGTKDLVTKRWKEYGF